MNASPQTPEKPRIRPQRCPECTVGYVIPSSKDGRFFSYKEIIVNLPMSVYIPTCGACGQIFPTAEAAEEIAHALEAEYKASESEIVKTLERLRRRKGIN
jgi:hypothetical protein